MAVLKKDVGKNARVDDDTRMTKTKLIQAVSKHTGIDSATVRAVYAAIVDEIIMTTRSGRSVMLTGFGRFYRLHKAGHTVQFTKSGTGEVPGYDVLKFSASSTLNRSLTSESNESGDH
jgi:bacterial DNA-binding protein